MKFYYLKNRIKVNSTILILLYSGLSFNAFAQNRVVTDSNLVSFFNSDTTKSSQLEFFIGEADTIVLDSSLTLQKDTNMKLNFIFNSTVQDIVSFSNKTFIGMQCITFSIERSVKIKLSNCKFINCGTVYFKFGEENLLYNDSTKTKVIIKNCDFIDTTLYNNNEEYSYQLYFKASSYDKMKNFHIGDIEILECYFSLNDTSTSFLTKNKLLPSRYSLFFFRNDNNVSVSHIDINDNKFEINSPNYRPFGIVFLNDGNSLFRTQDIPIDSLFNENNNINIQNNSLTAISHDPGHGIFIQGPYEGVRVFDNKIKGFGANFLNKTNELQRDGAIHLYGGRESHYSNDLRNINVSYNEVDAVGTGINLSGFRIATANNNVINILLDPLFYRDSLLNIKLPKSKHDQAGMNLRTGNYAEQSGQSRDLTVENNSIECNGVDRCMGIEIVSVKNFIIRNNVIQNPNNYGIIYHSNKGLVSQEFGNSIIEGNVVDFGNQKISTLKSEWFFPRYQTHYSGININRDFSKEQRQIPYESLTVDNNKIKMISGSGIEPIRIEKMESKEGIVKNKNYNVEYNLLETENGNSVLPPLKK